MKTNFFSQIAALGVTAGTLRVNIQPQQAGNLIVSVLLTDETVKDKAAQLIPPLVLKGSATELDDGFFGAIQSPIQQSSTLIANMGAYETAMNKAGKESRQEKEREASTLKEKDSKRRKFNEQMKKVEDLEKLKKIGEAIGQLPDLQQFSEFSEEIKKKSQQLRSQHRTLSLFEEPQPVQDAPIVQQDEAEEPDQNDYSHEEDPDDEFDNDENDNQ